MAEFLMPSLGADMDAGTMIEWKVKPGERVKRGDVVAEVETQKGIIEIEIFEDGVVEQLIVQPGEQVPVGAVLALIRLDGAPAMVTAPVKEAVATVPPTTKVVTPPPAAQPPPSERRVRISPLARKLADELGVDLNTLTPGADGTISRADVEQAAAAKPTEDGRRKTEEVAPMPVVEKVTVPPIVEKEIPTAAKPTTVLRQAQDANFQTGMRRAIATAMARSNREIPHYYLESRIDMSRALKWLEAENLKRSIKDRLLPVVLLLKAVAQALVEVPELNGYWIDDRLQVQEAIHIGFAISLRQGGLITPAIHHADQKTLEELMGAMRDLITRTRAGRLRSSEMSDATVTLTNLGDMGVEKVFGVIYPPQVALVGFGKIMEQPWAEKGMLGIRPIVTASLAADHRATDGARGAQFLTALTHKLQEVEKL
jgi:pyruvate dehydrogenase E2 component (dihydrolipoamide acetyltransferase)